MKRVISILLCILLSISIFPISAFADSRDISLEESLAYDLKQLTLFQGVSDTDFALGRAPSRTEAIVMLIRILGKESEALNSNWRHPFTDVAKWADKYIGYAYQNGLTDGISDTQFGTGTATSAMYLTFVLRALGYSDSDGDFVWNNPYDLATTIGILPSIVNVENFWRADVVSISYAALPAYLKNSNQTLAEKLISAGVFTKEKFDAVYDVNAFSKQSTDATCSSTTKKSTVAATTETAEAVKYKETVTFAYIGEPQNGSPYYTNGTYNRLVTNQTHEALYNYNYDTGELDSVLAVSCTDVNGDGKTYDVVLQKGVVFHDGEGNVIDTMDAEDVKFTWDYAGLGGYGTSDYKLAAYAYVDNIEVLDEYTVRFNLKQATYDFQFYLAGDSKILSKDAFDKIDDITTAEECGTGPYYWDYSKAQDGSYHTFTRFESYWGGLDKYPTKYIEWRVFGDVITEVSALQSGEIDMVLNFPMGQLSLIDVDDDFAYKVTSGNANVWYTMNWHKIGTQDETYKKIRQAMAYCIDREALVNVVYATSQGRGGTPSYYFTSPVVSGYKAVDYPYSYDVSKAQAIMTELGYSANNHLKMTIAFYQYLQPYAEVLQAFFKEAWIDLEFSVIDASQSNTIYAAGDGFDLCMNYTSLGGAMMYDVDRFHLSTGAAASGIYGYSNPEYDALSAEVKAAGSYEGMKEKFVALQKWLVDETPYTPLAIMNSCSAYVSSLGGYKGCMRLNDNIFNTIYVVEE